MKPNNENQYVELVRLLLKPCVVDKIVSNEYVYVKNREKLWYENTTKLSTCTKSLQIKFESFENSQFSSYGTTGHIMQIVKKHLGQGRKETNSVLNRFATNSDSNILCLISVYYKIRNETTEVSEICKERYGP